MKTVIDCIEGHYEVQKTSYGEAYVWCPEHAVVECECGERPVLTAVPVSIDPYVNPMCKFL